jgi:predicted SAM-dependent methyltransferase
MTVSNSEPSRLHAWRRWQRNLYEAGIKQIRAVTAKALRNESLGAAERGLISALAAYVNTDRSDPNTALLAAHTLKLVRFDLERRLARTKVASDLSSVPSRLHLGCGSRRVPGWLNVDVHSSDWDVDLAGGRLPWNENTFEVVVSEHVLEHLHFPFELVSLLAELKRVARPNATLWLSVPDMALACADYVHSRGSVLLEERRRRRDVFVGRGLDDVPTQHFINHLFHQDEEHKLLLDYDILSYALLHAGFARWERSSEHERLNALPDFPARNDSGSTLYVKVFVTGATP